jgi:ATP-dependent RNA helicase RhlE
MNMTPNEPSEIPEQVVAPVPEATWADTGLDPRLLDLIEKAGYRSPTLVQSRAIPAALEGKDVLVSSATGSGKTAGFVLPALQRFIGRDGTYILALAPTREIAQQTGAVFEQFGGPLGFRVAVCIGGASIPLEKEALQKSPHVIVATPGRLCDHLERGNVWLEFIQCLILDEADRMLDMGFSDQLNKITDQLPVERQAMMFSATFAPDVERLARKIMKNPVEVTIEKQSSSTPKIEQRLLNVPEYAKIGALMRIMRQEPGTIFVFANSKDKVSNIWRALHAKRIYDVTYIHSDCTQDHREQAIADFKSGKYRVLIATDVAGRGIDVEDVAHVVNFDLPKEAEDYVHRIGRTGRKGKTGKSTSFAAERDERLLVAIEKLVGPIVVDEGPRSRDDRPRDDRPRDDRPRDDRPRGDRPRGNDRGPRQDGRGPRREDRRDDNRPPRPEGARLESSRGPRQDGRGPRREDNRGPRPQSPHVPHQSSEAPREPRFMLDQHGNKILGPDGNPMIKRPRSRGGRNRNRGEGPREDRTPREVREVQSASNPVNSVPAPEKKGLIAKVLSWFKG